MGTGSVLDGRRVGTGYGAAVNLARRTGGKARPIGQEDASPNSRRPADPFLLSATRPPLRLAGRCAAFRSRTASAPRERQALRAVDGTPAPSWTGSRGSGKRHPRIRGCLRVS